MRIIGLWLLFSSTHSPLYNCSLWSCHNLLTNHFFFSNALHFNSWTYLDLSAAFKSLSPTRPPWHCPFHGFLASLLDRLCFMSLTGFGLLLSKVTPITWIHSQQHWWMGKWGAGSGRTKPGKLTQLHENSGAFWGRAVQTQTWFIQVDIEHPW